MTHTQLGYELLQRRLDNGLRVIVNPDHGAPVVAVNLWYDVGSRDEAPGETGFAHLFEHLMFQGSHNVASAEHLAAMQAAGGACNATTFFDRTNYFETVPVGAFELALWLEADRMATLTDALTQENLDNQREVVKEEKRQRYDNVPYGDAFEHLLALAFPAGHPYAHTVIGSMDDLNAATTDTAKRFFTEHYSPSNAVLTIVGDVEPEDAFARAKQYFGGIERRAVPVRPDCPALEPLDGLPSVEVAADVPSDALYLAWRLPTSGTRAFDAVDIALDVLGGGQTSRLHRRLVLADRLSPMAGASGMGLIGGTSLGYAYALAHEGITLEQVSAAILEEVTRLADDGPTDAELARVRVQFERAWLEALARVETRADKIGEYATLHDDPDRINRRIADLAAITADEVREAARTWLAPDARAVVQYRKEAR